MSRPRRLTKVLLYSHDTYGLGHLRRNLAIAGELLAGAAGVQVVLASGSPVLERVARPERLSCVQLPPVVKTGVEDYRARAQGLSLPLISRARSAILSDVVTRWHPDVLLVDHAPHGMKGELLPVFDTLRASSPDTTVILGLRDILDDPARVQATWTTQGVYDTLDSVYDHVLVYGQRDVFDVARAYRLPEPLAQRVAYCGYVTADLPTAALRPAGVSPTGGYLLGTIGGGGDGVEVLLATAEVARAGGWEAVLCTGPLMPDADRERLTGATAGRTGIVVVEHLTDMAAVASGASAVVTRGGYNSLCELIHLAVPTVVVPRVWPRREQLLRARAFAGRGLVHLVDPAAGDLRTHLTHAVHDAIRSPGGHRREVDLTGAQRAVRFLEHAVAERHPRSGAGAATGAGDTRETASRIPA